MDLSKKSQLNISFCVVCSHNGTHEDTKVRVIDYCDPNDQEAREDFWIFHLDT